MTLAVLQARLYIRRLNWLKNFCGEYVRVKQVAVYILILQVRVECYEWIICALKFSKSSYLQLLRSRDTESNCCLILHIE